MGLAGVLTIDLDAIVANWRALDARSAPGVETAAVVKADAYGLGVARVGPALARAGVRTFFVALPGEGAVLREALGAGPVIYVLGGWPVDDAGEAALYARHELRPVLNSAREARAFFAACPGAPCAVQLDSGMNRLGMEAAEFAALGPLPEQVVLVMSHLACADEPDHPQNPAQLAEFVRATEGLGRPRSLAATGGILLGPAHHFELTRPGIGLYGGLPFAEARPVVRLELPILAVREVAAGETVGYGADWRAAGPARIATVSGGYADGLMRALGPGRACAFLDGAPLPFAGRVSMDLITLDVTEHPAARPGAMVELLGPHQSVDALAAAAGTIGYEVLTALGRRYARRYTGG